MVSGHQKQTCGLTDLVPLNNGFDGMLPSIPSSVSSPFFEVSLLFLRHSSVPGRLVLPSNPGGKVILRPSIPV